MKRDVYDTEHEDLRSVVRSFAEETVAPELARWSEAGIVDRDLYVSAGKLGLLGLDVDEQFGGGGAADFRPSMVVTEELVRIGAMSVAMNFNGFNDLVGPYLTGFGTEAQKLRWLPDLCAGRTVSAIAMTEPDAGSDLRSIKTTAVRDGDHYVLNGSKTFISNGVNADVVIVVAKTDPVDSPKKVSLLVVERDMPGFTRGRKLEKIGLLAQDTAELYFDDVRVPVDNLLGDEGAGFSYLMQNLPRERIGVAVAAVASMRRAVALALDFVRERAAFSQRVADFQSTRFTLAELATETEVAQSMVDRCIASVVRGELTDVDAAMCKWWVTERQQRVVTRALQLHGGYGYMREYPIAMEFLDARINPIFGGTTEIMKDLIGRRLVDGPHPRPQKMTEQHT